MSDTDAKRSPTHSSGYVKVDLRMAERSAPSPPATAAAIAAAAAAVDDDDCAKPYDRRQSGGDENRVAAIISDEEQRTCDQRRQSCGAAADDATSPFVGTAHVVVGDARRGSGTDSDNDFDPYAHGNVENATSYWGTVTHLLLVGMSPTLLSLPSTFNQVGYLVGAIGSFATVMLYAYCMHMLVDGEYTLCRRERRTKMSYTQVVRRAFECGPRPLRWMGAYAQRLIYATLVTIWAGGNAIYVLLICDNVRTALRYFLRYEASERAVIAWLAAPLALLCWIPNLRLMVVYSVVSNAANVCCIAVIAYAAAQNVSAIGERWAVGDFGRLPYFLGVVFVTVNGTGLLMSLKSQMADPRRFRSKAGVLNVSYATTGLLYALFGLLCYARYGPDTRANVILNLPDNGLTKALQLAYAVGVVFFYPLVSYVTYDVVWNDACEGRFVKCAHRTALDYAAKTASAASSVALAYVFPNVAIFVSVTGTVCASLDSIIMPAVIDALVHSHRGRRPLLPLAKDLLIAAVGLLLLAAGLVDSVRELGRYYGTR